MTARLFRDERTIIMDRQNLPMAAAAPDIPAQIDEIRLPERSGGHDLRNGREARS